MTAGVRFQALGTVVSVLVTEPGAVEVASAILRAELAAVDAACSRFRGDSELSRLNRAGGREVRVSRLFADALAAALAAAEATDGDVDPTCGRSLIGIGYDRDFAEFCQDAELGQDAGARQERGLTVTPAAGWRAVELDPLRRRARVPEGVLLDLGATAKALAADRAALRIAEAVGCGVLVNLGGDIRVAGQPPAGGWCIGIADDLGPGDSPGGSPGDWAQAVTISSGGLATSSTKVRSWRRGDTALHHIVVPATGLPARTCWRTASVTAASCVDANAASTAAIIRGERAPGWLAALRLPSRLVRHDGTVLTVDGWPAEGDWPPADDWQAADIRAGLPG
ncbi:MAG TPA: FAD:protein FMN transferase [Streptosporangiaceae bacterium]|nr:FAD:protein FMN transferase [Streptosporangiaceae bacterium]